MKECHSFLFNQGVILSFYVLVEIFTGTYLPLDSCTCIYNEELRFLQAMAQ